MDQVDRRVNRIALHAQHRIDEFGCTGGGQQMPDQGFAGTDGNPGSPTRNRFLMARVSVMSLKLGRRGVCVDVIDFVNA